jgi:hypothetical protein
MSVLLVFPLDWEGRDVSQLSRQRRYRSALQNPNMSVSDGPFYVLGMTKDDLSRYTELA